MRTAYALHDTDDAPVLMVFTSRASRDSFCFSTLFTGNRARRIEGTAPPAGPPDIALGSLYSVTREGHARRRIIVGRGVWAWADLGRK